MMPSVVAEHCLQCVQLTQTFVAAVPVALRLLATHACQQLVHVRFVHAQPFEDAVPSTRPFDNACVLLPAIIRERRSQRVQLANERVAPVAAVQLLLATHRVQHCSQPNV